MSDPIDDSCADRFPIVLAIRLAGDVLAVAVADAVFGQRIVSVGIGDIAGEGACVAGVPVDHEVLVRDRGQHCCAFFAGAGVAGHLVFEQQDDVALGAGFRGFLELGVDRRAVGFLVFEPPEIETADAVGLEGFGQLDALGRAERPAL